MDGLTATALGQEAGDCRFEPLASRVIQETPLRGAPRLTKRDLKDVDENDAVGGMRRPIQSLDKEPGLA
eukprot:2697390-Amphidinium_carterae.1